MLHYFTDIASYYFTDIMFTDIALCCVVVALAIGFACLLRVKLIAVNDQFAELIVCLGVVGPCALWVSLLSQGRTVKRSTPSRKECLRAGM